jgi:hypothetical protein
MENEGQLKNVSSNLLIEDVPVCPRCGCSRVFRDGLRDLSDGSKTQRFLCRK